MSNDIKIIQTTIAVMPMFPTTIVVNGASLTLQADGRWEGDKDSFIAALKSLEQDTSGSTAPILWLIANSISRETSDRPANLSPSRSASIEQI